MLAVLVSPAGNVVCPAGWADGMATSAEAASTGSGAACEVDCGSASVRAAGAGVSS